MLRQMPFSKPIKQRLFLNNTSSKVTSVCPTLNVAPIVITNSVHKQNGINVKADITEIKPSQQNRRSRGKSYSLSLPKRGSLFVDKVNRPTTVVQSRTGNIKITEKNNQIFKIIDNFYKILADNNIFQQRSGQILQLKSKTFKEICYYILNSLISKNAEKLTFLALLNKQKNIKQFIENNKQTKIQIIPNRKLKLFSKRIEIMVKQIQTSDDLSSLRKQSVQLRKSIEYLLQHKNQLQNQIKLNMNNLDLLKRHFLEIKGKIENYSIESEKIESKIKQGRGFLQKIDELTTSIHQFAHSSANSQVRVTAENFKNLETDMFKLTDLVSHCSHGKKDFQKSITIWDIQKRMESQLKMFNKYLMQNTHTTYEQKCKDLKDFLAKINNQYSRIYEQLVLVIQQKTKYLQSFVEYVELWEQSYLQKSVYLGNLRTNFGYHCMKIDELRQVYFNDERNKENLSFCNQIILEVQDIIHLFKLGNYFY